MIDYSRDQILWPMFSPRCLSKIGVDIRETHPGFTLDNFRKELADSLVGGFLQVECLWLVFVLWFIDQFICIFRLCP